MTTIRRLSTSTTPSFLTPLGNPPPTPTPPFPFPPLLPGNHWSAFCHYSLACSHFLKSYTILHNWSHTSFLFTAEEYSMTYFVFSPVGGQLGCFQFGVVINKPAENFSCMHLSVNTCISLAWIPRRRMPGSYREPFRKLQNLFPSWMYISHFWQQGMRVLVPARLYQHLQSQSLTILMRV